MLLFTFFHFFSLAEVLSLKSDVSKYTLARTESLISDVLSFYSLDGTETTNEGGPLSSPGRHVTSQSESMKTAAMSLSPTSTQYETAPEISTVSNSTFSSLSVPENGRVSADLTSTLSFDTATLQVITI